MQDNITLAIIDRNGALYTKVISYFDLVGGMIRSQSVTALATFFLLSRSATVPQSICPYGEVGSINELLYFGMEKHHGVFTPTE